MALLDRISPHAFGKLAEIVERQREAKRLHTAVIASAGKRSAEDEEAPESDAHEDEEAPPFEAAEHKGKDKKAAKTAKTAATAATAAAAPGGFVRIASVKDAAAQGFTRVAGGMYRKAHEIWELRKGENDDGYALVRKREERLPDFRED